MGIIAYCTVSLLLYRACFTIFDKIPLMSDQGLARYAAIACLTFRSCSRNASSSNFVLTTNRSPGLGIASMIFSMTCSLVCLSSSSRIDRPLETANRAKTCIISFSDASGSFLSASPAISIAPRAIRLPTNLSVAERSRLLLVKSGRVLPGIPGLPVL